MSSSSKGQKPSPAHAKMAGPEKPFKTILRLFSYFRFNLIYLILGLVLIIGSTVLEVRANGLLSPIFDSLLGDNAVSELMRHLSIMILIVVISAAAQYLGSRFMVLLSQRTAHQIRQEMFTHLQSLPIRYFDQRSHGDIMSNFTNDVDMLLQALEQSFTQIVVSVVTVVGTFMMMLFLNVILTFIVIGMLIVMMFVIRFVGSRSAKYYREEMMALGKTNGYIEEMTGGQKVVKVFNYEDRAVESFEELNEELRIASSKAGAYSVVLMPIMGNLSFVLYAIVAMVGAFFSMQGVMTVGNIAAYLQYTRTISRPITQVSNQFNSLVAAIAGAERIFKLLDEAPEDNEGEVTLALVDQAEFDAIQAAQADSSFAKVGHFREGKRMLWRIPTEDGNARYIDVQGDIRFHDVDFSYTEGTPILHEISLYAKPGQKLALVGSTGAGKTTITNLLNRFYEIDEGSITFDGIDIRTIDKISLRSCITMVLQDVHLFEGTVADNIRYGRLHATDAEVEEAARLANAEHFIQLMPDGYQALLTRDGLNLSQGERQLISIARAAVSDPVVLILDEATSSVDTRTERLIEKGMDSLMQDQTTFAIAHRLSTVRHSNAIMVMEQGRIIERGDHDDLMALKGRYYALNVGTAELE